VGVLWVLTSDVWLRIFLSVSLEELVIKVKSKIVIVSIVSLSILIIVPVVSPVVMKVGRESAIGVGVLWVLSSNIWLWILSGFSLNKRVGEVVGSPVVSPVVVVEAGEGRVWMGIGWVGTSDIWLRIFGVLLLGEGISEVESSPVVSPVIMVEAGEVESGWALAGLAPLISGCGYSLFFC